MKTLSYANGDEMPILGLGTWKSQPGEVYEAVKAAIHTGYRHIDCAPIYGNEPEVGKALQECFNEGVVSRDEMWITSKLWNDSHAPEHVRPALEETLNDLQLDTLDLYLVHWPVAIKHGLNMPGGPEDFISLDERPIADTWEAMEALVDHGLAEHIGVSNFNVPKLKRLTDEARIQPEMNQIELHPYLQQPEMLEYAQEADLHVTAYSPLGSKDRPDGMKAADEPILLEDPTIGEIAERHDATPAQVLISWAIHRGTAVIPKSVNAGRIQENFEAAQVELTDDDMAAIAELDRGRRYVDGEFFTVGSSPYTLEGIWEE